MDNKEIEIEKKADELPDEWWYRVYAGVILMTVLVITALWTFSRFFS